MSDFARAMLSALPVMVIWRSLEAASPSAEDSSLLEILKRCYDVIIRVCLHMQSGANGGRNVEV
jgi:hypothetical protein